MSNRNEKILILGSTGFLGSIIDTFLKKQNYNVFSHSFTNTKYLNADLEKVSETQELIKKIIPDVILNMTGLTDVEKCEKNPQKSYLSNVKIVENICNSIPLIKKDCYLVHISTDHVYDGVGPHTEKNINLKNYYAFSKYASELVALKGNSIVLRTNFFGKSFKNRGLTDWLYYSLRNKSKIKVFNDVLFSPLSTNTLVETLNTIINLKPRGLYNLGSRDGMSKSEFAFSFANLLNLDTSHVEEASIDEVSIIKTIRPKDMRMDISKIEQILKVKLPLLNNEIKIIVEQYK